MKLSHSYYNRVGIPAQIKQLRLLFQFLVDERSGISQRGWVREYRSKIVLFTKRQIEDVRPSLQAPILNDMALQWRRRKREIQMDMEEIYEEGGHEDEDEEEDEEEEAGGL